jgi:SAM-dependent methyltransferase
VADAIDYNAVFRIFIVMTVIISGHPAGAAPSDWVRRWAPLVPEGGAVLDVACGGGRHARFFAVRGHPVDAVDRDPQAIGALSAVTGVHALCADIENGPWPYAGRSYAAVVVTHYLHRPLFPRLLAALAPGGLLIYETFAAGNARFGRPANPDFLLRPRELLEVALGGLQVLAYEHVCETQPRPAVMQRICAVNASGLDAGENPFFFLNS